MSPLRISLVFLLGLLTECHAAKPTCNEMYEGGLSKCFSDKTGKPSEAVIAVLTENKNDPETKAAICSNDAVVVSCVDDMTVEVLKRSACQDPMAQLGVASITDSLKKRINQSLCGQGTPSKSINH